MMDVNTTPMQPYQIPSDESYGAFEINPANSRTFKQFDVHQVDHQDRYSTSTADTSTDPTARKRKRTINDRFRQVHNQRERIRTGNINDAFKVLKNKIPGGAEKKLTKVQILRQASAYIKVLEQQLRTTPDPSDSIGPITSQGRPNQLRNIRQ
ncbi:helix-loop-helix domain-containing protein [Endozoicomonas sp. YOMI1]|uniref:helix-loop-helix domain-containing protein n=1 Tax=Endozoicomonas sp. YOMI1 TaxID=2828739 RepID=UPI002148062D|nr:helix-loop-helix domain-containing protein [Endozoicomonas sp. YOMI1]